MGIQFPPIAFLYLLYLFIYVFFFYIIHIFVQWYKALLNLNLNYITVGPLHDPVTWYGINYTGTQVAQWDFQNKGKLSWTGTSSFVLEGPLRHLRPSIIYFVPCDRIVQRAYCTSKQLFFNKHPECRYIIF